MRSWRLIGRGGRYEAVSLAALGGALGARKAEGHRRGTEAMRLLMIVAAGLIVGCTAVQDLTQEPPFRRAERVRAELLEMYRDCLLRKRADPAIDCAQYRP